MWNNCLKGIEKRKLGTKVMNLRARSITTPSITVSSSSSGFFWLMATISPCTTPSKSHIYETYTCVWSEVENTKQKWSHGYNISSSVWKDQPEKIDGGMGGDHYSHASRKTWTPGPYKLHTMMWLLPSGIECHHHSSNHMCWSTYLSIPAWQQERIPFGVHPNGTHS